MMSHAPSGITASCVPILLQFSLIVMSLQKLKSLNPFQQKKAAAILGALVADAAGLLQTSSHGQLLEICLFVCLFLVAPLHWIYDKDNVSGQDKIAGLIEAEGRAEFYPTSHCPFYTIPTGDNSTYADQLYVTLKNIAENKGMLIRHSGLVIAV